jgi:hypothetical protein
VSGSRIRRWLTESSAETNPDSPDPRLSGRTYAIPFDRVWNAALALAGEESGRWRLTRADDENGVILTEAKSLVFRLVDDIRIQVSLDDDAQTRVDMSSRSRTGSGDLGVNARRIGRFFRALDRRLEATPEEILEPAPKESPSPVGP